MVIDKWIFKKVQNGWRVAEIQESVDSWDTAIQSETSNDCKAVNEGREKQYMNP